MFAHLRRLLKHSIVYGMAETVSRGIGFILLFIHIRFLTESEIGIRTAVYGAAAFLAVFYTLGLDNAFLRYFMDEEHADKKKDIFTTAFYFSALMGIIFLTVVIFLAESVSYLLTKSDSHDSIIRLIFLILIFDTAVIYPTLVLRAENRLGYFSLIAFSRFILFISLNVLLVWVLRRGLMGVFEANLLVVVLISVLLFPVLREYMHGRLSIHILKRMLAFGIPTIFTILCMRVIDFSDRYVILYLLGDSGKVELGRYAPAYALGMVGIMVFVNSFRLAWQPFFLSLKNDPDAHDLFSRIATYYAMFIGMVFLGITLFREEIFTLYAPSYPLALAGIIPFVSMAYIFFGFYIIMLAGIFIREKTRYLPVATFAAAALNVGLNFIFVPAFGIIGAAYTTIIAYITMAVVMYILSHNVYRVNYEFKRLGVILFLTTIPIWLSMLIQPEGNVMNFLYRGVLFLIPPAVYLFSDFLLPEERNRLRQLCIYYFKKG